MSESEHEPSKAEVVLGILAVLGYFLFTLLGIASVVLVFIKGAIFLEEHIHPIIVAIGAFSLFILIPISIVLLFFKKTRHIGGFGFLIYSFILGFHLWFWCLILAKVFAGVFWMLVGLFFAGLGIIPIAIIATVLSGEWWLAGGVVFNVVVILIFRTIGMWFLGINKQNPQNNDSGFAQSKVDGI